MALNWQSGGGSSLPDGGTIGQALVKKSNANQDVEWNDAAGNQWVVLSRDLAISANELQAIQNSKKPMMWFDGYYYTPITTMEVSSEWGYGYLNYIYNNYRYSIGIHYDGDDWDQLVTWSDPSSYQLSATLSNVNQNGGIQISQNISGKTSSMLLYPDWTIPNFVNSRLVMHSITKSNELMTRFSQSENIIKTGRVSVNIFEANKSDGIDVDISEFNFSTTDEYRVITTFEKLFDGTERVVHNVSGRSPISFRINVRNDSGGSIQGDTWVNYMVLSNKYYELYSSSTSIIDSTVSGDKFTWAQITTDKSSYNDFSYLKNVNVRMRIYTPDSFVPYLAQYDTEGTEMQDAEHFYYPIKFTKVDGTVGTTFDTFKYLVRSRRGGSDYILWLASALSTDRLDTYRCPSIDRITIVKEM